MRIKKSYYEGDITKLVFELSDGLVIENCYKHPDFICLSSQVGCNLGCRFCFTGGGGLLRNLTSDEMIEQIGLTINHANQSIGFEEISFSGMGEPLLNINNVLKVMDYINEIPCRISISTTGIIDAFDKLFSTNIKFALDISLHGSNDLVRSELMPINKKYGINNLMKSLLKYSENREFHWLYVDYLLLKGINDSEENLGELIALLNDEGLAVELKHYNSKFDENIYQSSDRETFKKFRKELMRHGIRVRIEKSLGTGIGAGCGQMAYQYLSDR